MKAIMFGYGNIGCTGLDALLRHGFTVPAVFTHRDDPNETIWFDSVAGRAAARGITVRAPDDVNHPMWVDQIRQLEPDVIFSFYCRQLLKPAILDLAPAGAFNLHGSLLPAFRGRCPLNWALVEGERETGVTLHHMTPRPDDGDIVMQRRVTIDEEDTAPTLANKLNDATRLLLDEALPLIRSGTAPRTPQDHSRATVFPGRRPADGDIDWSWSAVEVRNLVRAVTRPWPGAFTHHGSTRLVLWNVSLESGRPGVRPGTILSSSPLIVACGEGAVRVEIAEAEDGVCLSGGQLAEELNLLEGATLGRPRVMIARKKVDVLILGANGFIGSALSERLLEDGNYRVHAMDLGSSKISSLVKSPDFRFVEGDISIHREWIEYHVKKCDVILPLVAIATPIEYIRRPLDVFELDFEENLKIVRYCVKYGKRLIFPSTSEVYGQCDDEVFDEQTSNLVVGPICKQRWIYSSSKQLLDRVIWAYGQQGLRFTLFRPFNWIGPRLDSLDAARIGSSRVITQFILNLVTGSPILLVDGGSQRRCFTDVADGIECLFRMIDCRDGTCDGAIVNIGNPDNEASMRELAMLLVRLFDEHPLRQHFPPFAGVRDVESKAYYGEGYQDVRHRRPSIRVARRLLDWCPSTGLEESIRSTLDFFLREAVADDLERSVDETRASVLPGVTSVRRQLRGTMTTAGPTSS